MWHKQQRYVDLCRTEWSTSSVLDVLDEWLPDQPRSYKHTHRALDLHHEQSYIWRSFIVVRWHKMLQVSAAKQPPPRLTTGQLSLKFMCFRLQSGEKVGTMTIFLF